jgi:hypothetical protein
MSDPKEPIRTKEPEGTQTEVSQVDDQQLDAVAGGRWFDWLPIHRLFPAPPDETIVIGRSGDREAGVEPSAAMPNR